MQEFEVTKAKKSELEYIMLCLAKEEKWHYSKEDVEAYYAFNSNGIYILKEKNVHEFEKKEQKPIGCIILTSYLQRNSEEIIASIGLFIVDKNYRQQGKYGPMLWQELTKIAENMKLSLNSVSVPGIKNFYGRHGFFPAKNSDNNEIINKRYQLLINNSKHENHVNNNLPIFIAQLKANDVGMKALTMYDEELFGRLFPERANFLSIWAARPDAIVLAYFTNNAEGNKVEGYGILTECGTENDTRYMNLSPFYANQIDVAHQLLKLFLLYALSTKATVIQLNTVAGNTSAESLLTGNGFSSLDESHDTQLNVKLQQRTF